MATPLSNIRVLDMSRILACPWAGHRVRHLTNALGQDVPTVSDPVDFSETPVSYAKAPPPLGEHTDEVLRKWLGYSEQMIAELRDKSAI
jgi:crotonobetainyl-CoA:carnitine CoA-transferase CaiB-like acyl-CoA transferase